MQTDISQPTVLNADDGLRLESGPGRDVVFKLTGDDTNGAFDYFTVEVAPKGGPPLHVHHNQEETIHVLKGRFRVRIGEELFELDEGGFAHLPSATPHAFLNLTDEPGELIVVFAPGGGTGSSRSSVRRRETGCPTTPRSQRSSTDTTCRYSARR